MIPVDAIPATANGIAAALGRAQKGFRSGTHRMMSPAETVERVRPHMAAIGITRMANVTGLDRIGIPVVMVVRPNSRSLAVSQGKGLDLDAAKASGLMESVEGYHAEHIALPLRLASYEELRGDIRQQPLDPMTLVRNSRSQYHPNLPILWVEGVDLLQGCSAWVPFELVHFHYTLPQPIAMGCFQSTTNGLASGNHLLEAVSHAICEVVERDAMTLWPLRGPEARQQRRLDLSSVDHAGCVKLLERYDTAGFEVSVWDVTTDIGLPVMRCSIIEREREPWQPYPRFAGTGCHPSREVALVRALTEAAQNRLTVISGSRDDAVRKEYQRVYHSDMLDRMYRRPVEAQPLRFQDVATYDGATLEDDVSWELHRLREAGFEQVAMVDLTKPEFGLCVVRVVIPGLEGIGELPDYLRMGRAASVAVEASGGVVF